MKNQFNKKIKDKINYLPQFEPELETWDLIRAEMEFNRRLKKTIPQLKELDCDNNVWNHITEHLKIKKENKSIRSKIIYFTTAAASIILLVSSYFIFRSNEKVNISYDEEIVYENTTTLVNNDFPDPLAYITKQCKFQIEKCENPEFIEMKEQLLLLEQELIRLHKIEKIYGTSDAIVKSIIKMENLKSEIIHDLMKRLNT